MMRYRRPLAPQEERPPITERISSAYTSDDLALRRSVAAVGDAEILLATGMTAQRRRLVLALYRLIYAQDASAYPEARAGLGAFVVDAARKEAWMVTWGSRRSAPTARELRDLSDGVLKRRIVDVCPDCAGRRYPVLPGSRTGGAMALQARVCSGCNGTGRIVYRGRNPWWTERGAWLTNEIDAMVDGFGAKVARKLGRGGA